MLARFPVFLGCILLGAANLFATTHFVSLDSSAPTPPYTNWATAATNIQDAIDAANVGDQIWVTNGVYDSGARYLNGSNRVAITKAIAIQSLNGPQDTIIKGNQEAGTPYGATSIRCAYLTNGAVLSGFTLTNGATTRPGFGLLPVSAYYGGGVLCLPTGTAFLSNCIIAGNAAQSEAGGVYGGVLDNCLVAGNSAYAIGGGARFCTLNNSTLVSNVVTVNAFPPNPSGNYGGGASDCTLSNCTVGYNSAYHGGGVNRCVLDRCNLQGNFAAIWGGGAYDSTLDNCIIRNNTATGGGGVRICNLNNCTIIGNSAKTVAPNARAQGGGALGGTLNNCAIAGNTSSHDGGGIYVGVLHNCVVYYNSAPNGSNYDFSSFTSPALDHCCTIPLPAGDANFTNEPLFMDYLGADLRLQSNSPCVNSGSNLHVTNSVDMDGATRIAGGTVDVGPYEFQTPASIISYAWLQQYSLPTDGSVDGTDSDSDGMSNWQEWQAGTIPIDASSVLRMEMPAITAAGVTLTWSSVSNRVYSLERATGTNGPSAFSALRSNVPGLSGSTGFTDTDPPIGSPAFYRVSVRLP